MKLPKKELMYLCSECHQLFPQKEVSIALEHIGGRGYVDVATCIPCLDKQVEKSRRAVMELRALIGEVEQVTARKTERR